MHESKKATLSVDEYARLADIAKEAGADVIILPGGGHAELEEFLTCNRCGRFVCYKHDPTVKPGYRNGQVEPTVRIPTPEHRGWSRPIPERIIERFENALIVTPSKE